MEQEKATTSFRSKHPDLSGEDVEYVANWIETRTDKLRQAGWSYNEILEVAYNDLFTNRKSANQNAALLAKGQQMKEEEIQKGKKSQLLGAPSPTAQTREKSKKPTIHMNPAERQEMALDRFKANRK
jgi:hypothetical protein